jgi:hypothetical protein
MHLAIPISRFFSRFHITKYGILTIQKKFKIFIPKSLFLLLKSACANQNSHADQNLHTNQNSSTVGVLPKVSTNLAEKSGMQHLWVNIKYLVIHLAI